MQYIDIEYSIMKAINNEMTHKCSAHGHLKMLEKKVIYEKFSVLVWKCYRTDLTLVSVLSVGWLTNYTTVDSFLKIFRCYYWN